MGLSIDAAGDEGVQFFGQVSASVSHEIKNVLAIINETAGLLKDFALMHEKGIPIDLQRLGTLADKITGQIRRADKIVKHMNNFAHSVDSAVASVNLGEMLSLMTALAARRALMQGVTLAADTPEDPVTIVTSPFRLEYLLWRILDAVAPVAGKDKTIRIRAEETSAGARIKFYPLDGNREKASGALFFPGQEILLDTLKGELSGDGGNGELVLSLPAFIEQDS